MSLSLRSALADALIQAKFAVLIGLPATMAMFLATTLILESSGWSVLSSPAATVGLLACSLLIGLQTAVEVAAIHDDGIDALARGSRLATLARYLLATVLVATATAFLLAVTLIGLSAALDVLRGESVDPGQLIGLAGAYVLYRGANAFRTGYRRTGAETSREPYDRSSD